MAAALPISLLPCRYREIRKSPRKNRRAMPSSVISVIDTTLKRKVSRTPSILRLPKNWAPKIPAPDTIPNMLMLKTNSS